MGETQREGQERFKSRDYLASGEEERNEQGEMLCLSQDSHYVGQCLNNKKSKVKAQKVAASANTQVSKFATKFKEFSSVFCLSSSVTKDAWFMDSGTLVR